MIFCFSAGLLLQKMVRKARYHQNSLSKWMIVVFMGKIIALTNAKIGIAEPLDPFGDGPVPTSASQAVGKIEVPRILFNLPEFTSTTGWNTPRLKIGLGCRNAARLLIEPVACFNAFMSLEICQI
jgi:hypothetical protein